jgi:hypothetical protein
VTLAPEAPQGLVRIPRRLRAVPEPGAVHHHVWIVREGLHTELGRYERWFECEVCGDPYE